MYRDRRYLVIQGKKILYGTDLKDHVLLEAQEISLTKQDKQIVVIDTQTNNSILYIIKNGVVT